MQPINHDNLISADELVKFLAKEIAYAELSVNTSRGVQNIAHWDGYRCAMRVIKNVVDGMISGQKEGEHNAT